MPTPSAADDHPAPRRRARSVAWAAIGCTLLALLGLSLLGACGLLAGRLLDRLVG